jgi:sulfur carrier protein ThiS
MPEDEDGKRIPPSVFLMSNQSHKVVYNLGWHPDNPETYEWRNQTLLNTYIPTEYQPKRGTPAPWLRHLKWLVSDENVQEQILNWMAYNVQHPGKKLNYGLFISGPERVGKDMLFAPLVKIIGSHNVKEIGAEALHGEFNDYLYQTKLLIVGEMHTRANEQRSVENKLKTMLASTASDSIRLNLKGLNPIYIPNLLSIIFMSNHRDALTITGNNAARYLCWWCDVIRKPDEYYAEFDKWLSDDDNIRAIFHFLINRDLSNFNPKASAKMNEFTEEIVEASKDAIEAEIGYRVEDKQIPFHVNLVSTDDVCLGLQLDVLRNRTRVGRLMKQLGFEPRKVVGRVNGQLYRKTLYIVRGFDLYNQMSDTDILKQYKKQAKI